MRTIPWSSAFLSLVFLPLLPALAAAPPPPGGAPAPAPKGGAAAPGGAPAPAPQGGTPGSSNGAPAPAPRTGAPGTPGGPPPPAPGSSGAQADQAKVQRGKYLATIAGCEDCHTPKRFDPKLGMPVPDQARAYAGHPKDGPDPEGTIGTHDMALIGPTFTSFKLPFGTVYASNVTSDKKTGIGSWTEAQFVKAMRTGRAPPHDVPILPPMPWPNVAAMNDDDLRAVYAFLQSTKPVQNQVKPPNVPNDVMNKIGAANDKIAASLQKPVGGAPAKGR